MITRFFKNTVQVTRMGANAHRVYKAGRAMQGGAGVVQGLRVAGGVSKLGSVGGLVGAALADHVLDDGKPETQVTQQI